MAKFKLTIEGTWLHYRKTVVPKEASPVQVEETRLAFFAGFATCLKVGSRIGEADISERAAVEWIHRLMEEVNAFAQSMARRS